MQLLVQRGKRKGLTRLIITSEEEDPETGEKMELGVPHEVVKNLLAYSDLFVLPSTSEACSLIMLEAGASKNLVVLNSDLPSFYDFGGQRMEPHKSFRTHWIEFGSRTR